MSHDPARYDELFGKLETYVATHSPTGIEAEMDRLLFQQFTELGIDAVQDKAGNIIARIPGTEIGRASCRERV